MKEGMVSVFKRLSILFLLFILLLYSGLALGFLRFSFLQQKQMIEEQQNRVRNTADLLEQQLQGINNLENNIASDSRVRRLAYNICPDEYERSQMVLGLIASTQGNTGLNELISEVVISFPFTGIQLSTSDRYSRQEYTAADFWNIGRYANELSYRDGLLEINYAYPLRLLQEEEYIPDYLIHIELSEKLLSTYLETFRMESGQGAFLVLSGENSDQIFAVGRDDEQELMMQWDQVKGKIAEKNNDIYSIFHANKKKYMIWAEEISTYPIMLVVYQDTGVFNHEVTVTLLLMSGIILFSGLLFGIVIRQTYRTVRTPLYKIISACEVVENGELNVRLHHEPRDEFRYIYESFNRMIDRIQKLISDNREQNELLQNMELLQLQSQINPHFLYNSFFIIKYMAQNESYEQIDAFVTSLAKYYRFVNKEVNQNIPLWAEVEHMTCYIEIQQMRFGDKIIVEKEELPGQAAEFLVPKLILQPIVENAYNYGLHDILQDGRLWIGFRAEGDWLEITVEDNGNTMDEEKLESLREQVWQNGGEHIRHALNNVRRRLELAYNRKDLLRLEIGREGGLKVTIRLDLSIEIKNQSII